jgi:hypothetical protein
MRAAQLTLLLVVLSCHPPFPDSGEVEGDTDTDTDTDADSDTDGDVDNPPVELCSEPWGWVETDLSLEQGGKQLTVVAPSDAHMTYDFVGQADLCDQDCSAHWLDEMFITDSESHETEIGLPLRMGKGDQYFAYFHVDVPAEADGTTEHCYLDTSAGKYWLEIVIGDQ